MRYLKYDNPEELDKLAGQVGEVIGKLMATTAFSAIFAVLFKFMYNIIAVPFTLPYLMFSEAWAILIMASILGYSLGINKGKN